MFNYPTKFNISSGSGKAKEELVAFDNALIDAGIANYNLVRVSSILPIGCVYSNEVTPLEGSPLLTAYACISSDKPGCTISSAVCAAIPKDEQRVGLIMEYSGFCDSTKAEKTVRAMALEAMKNHEIECKDLLSSSNEITVPETGYAVSVSAVALW